MKEFSAPEAVLMVLSFIVVVCFVVYCLSGERRGSLLPTYSIRTTSASPHNSNQQTRATQNEEHDGLLGNRNNHSSIDIQRTSVDVELQRTQQRLEQERMRIEADRALAAASRQRAEDESRRREVLRQQREKEQKQAEIITDRLHEIHVLLIDEIDYFIRTRRRFDSRNPLNFEVQLHQLVAEEDIQNAFQDLQDVYNDANFRLVANKFHQYPSIQEFIRNASNNFVLKESQILNGNGTQQTTMISVKHLTPFQGSDTHRVFGEFNCFQCNNTWSSASTWKDKWQQCRNCESKCYPFTQHVLLQSDNRGDGELRPHHSHRCQKCKELGRLCNPGRFYSV